MPLISIILPAYNVEKYIARALDSCINQTLKDIEIIVVDDKGQDKSIDIAKEYASRDNRIKIIDNKENLKLFHARINGVKHANAEYIMFLDSDDELELNACEVIFNFIGKNKFDFVCFNFKDYKLNEIKDNKFVSFNETILNINEHKKLFSQYGWDFWAWSMCNKVFARNVYLESVLQINTNNNKINMAEDALVFYFILTNCKGNVGYINEFLYRYYENPESITKKDDTSGENVIYQYDLVLDIIENSQYNDFKKRYLFWLTIFYWRFRCGKYCDYYKYLEYIKQNASSYNKKQLVQEKLCIYRALRKTSIKNFIFYVFYKYKLKFIKDKDNI